MIQEHLALILLTLFVVKHFICDFTKLQPPWMFLNKGTYGHPGGIAHVLVHAIPSMWILTASASSDRHWTFFGLILFEAEVHYHMDWFKMWWNKRRGYTTTDHQFWFWLGIDQLVHYLTYVLMVWVWV